MGIAGEVEVIVLLRHPRRKPKTRSNLVIGFRQPILNQMLYNHTVLEPTKCLRVLRWCIVTNNSPLESWSIAF